MQVRTDYSSCVHGYALMGLSLYMRARVIDKLARQYAVWWEWL